jgi:hypothetical protein
MYNFTWNRLVTSGWNTAFTAEVYAQIQGYTHDRRMGEDVDIGERISCIRGYLSHGTFLPQVGTTGRLPTRSEGSPRRWLLRVARHVEPYERTNAYANFFSRSYEHLVRIRSTEELLEEAQAVAHISQKNIHFFEEVLTKDWRFTLDIRGNRVIALQQYYKVLECLGFRQRDIEIQGTEVRIHRFDALADHLAMYRIKNASNAPDLFPLQTKGRINWRSCTRSL